MVDNDKVIRVNNKANEIVKNLSKNLRYIPNIGAIRELIFPPTLKKSLIIYG